MSDSSVAEAAADLPELVAGRYRPLGLLGRSAVHLVEHLETRQRFALRTLALRANVDESTVQRIQRELVARSEIGSEHVLPVLDVGVIPELPALYLASELLEGSDFARLSADKPQPPESVARWFPQIAKGLAAAHARGFAHGALRPEKLFLTRSVDGSEQVKILDMGLAALAGELPPDVETSEIRTGAYEPPEGAADGAACSGPAADIWALGMIAFRLLTGRDHRSDERQPQVGARLGAAFDDWFLRSCALDPSQRWPDVIEQANVLSRALDAMGSINSAIERIGNASTVDLTPSGSGPSNSDSLDEGEDSFLRAVAAVRDQRPPDAEPDRTGTDVAHFRIGSVIGRGGMGIVYVAEDSRLKRRVALKVLPLSFARDPERRFRFVREARTASAIVHPNIATIFDVGEADGCVYIAMELVEGRTLRHQLESGRLDVAEALRIAREVLRGLARAHDAGIVHRDIKPDNVMLGADGSVKVLDFGLAKAVKARDAELGGPPSGVLTIEGHILGTPSYMSPEQAHGRPVDQRSDVFSFGVMLYEMLAGERPFRAETTVGLLAAIDRDQPRRLSSVVPAARPVEAVVERCLAKTPDDRFASCHEVLRALERPAKPAGLRVRALLLLAVVAIAASAAWVGGGRAGRSAPDAKQEPPARGSGAPTPTPAPGVPPAHEPAASSSTVAPIASTTKSVPHARPAATKTSGDASRIDPLGDQK